MTQNHNTLLLAGFLYSAYCQQTDFKSAVTGQPLPSWEELKKDESKALVVEAWCATARAAEKFPVALLCDQPEITEQHGTAEFHRQKAVLQDKAIRTKLDAFVEFFKRMNHPAMILDYRSPERMLSLRALQQARHWLGEDLANRSEPYPYPRGNDPATIAVDPAADKAQS